jgi:glycosyltransferase involved in cell wall biosynthesis
MIMPPAPSTTFPAPNFLGHLALQQRVIPAYRAPFFDLLAKSCQGGLSLFAGQPLPIESIPTAAGFETAQLTATHNQHFRDPQSSLYLCRQPEIIEWLEAQDPAALIVEANPRYLSTRRAIRWMQRRGRPVLGWGLGAPRGGNPLERFFRLRFLRSLDGIIAYSRRGAEEYRSLRLGRVFVAYNAVSPRPRQAPPDRALHPDRIPTVLFVGRLQERKRLDILLRACASLATRLQPRLVIVGDGPARAEFQSLAQTIYPQTEFVGALHGPELAPYFAAADLFALPGTGGLAVQQAMTHGLPVIVAQGDGTQDDLVRPESGWQVPPGDQAAFTATLRQALADLPRLRKMGAESYRIVAEEINLEAMAAAFVRALNEVSPTI